MSCRWSRGVRWGVRALCIGCSCGWSRGEWDRSVLIVAPVGQVVKWQVEWHVVDDIIDLHTACWQCVILIDESTVGRFRSFKGHRSRRRRRGGRLCCSLLHRCHIYVVLRIFIIILLILMHLLPWNITPSEGRIRSGDVLCSQSERFDSVERTITSLSVGLEVGWEGRVGWQRQEWLALKHFWILNFMHLRFTNVKQSKLKFRI